MTNRPIYLVSVTPCDDQDIIHLPILETKWLLPSLDVSAFDGIVLTSKNGADALERIDPVWKSLPVICVGKATQRRAAELGAKVLDTAEGYGEGLFERISTCYGDKRWLYARPKTVASDFASKLRHAGVDIQEAVVYETVCRTDLQRTSIEDDAVLIFTSPSAAECFQRRFDLCPSHSIVVIGKTTEKSLDTHPVHIAAEPTITSCIALAKQLAKENV